MNGIKAIVAKGRRDGRFNDERVEETQDLRYKGRIKRTSNVQKSEGIKGRIDKGLDKRPNGKMAEWTKGRRNKMSK